MGVIAGMAHSYKGIRRLLRRGSPGAPNPFRSWLVALDDSGNALHCAGVAVLQALCVAFLVPRFGVVRCGNLSSYEYTRYGRSDQSQWT